MNKTQKINKNFNLANKGLCDINKKYKIEKLLIDINTEFYANNFEKCIELCDEVLFFEPTLIYPLGYKAASLFNLNRFEEALFYYDIVLQNEFNPDHTSVEQKYGPLNIEDEYWIYIAGKGLSLQFLGRYEEAIVCLDKSLEIKPHYYVNLRGKAECLENLGKIKEAIVVCETSLIFNTINGTYPQYRRFIDKYYKLIDARKKNLVWTHSYLGKISIIN